MVGLLVTGVQAVVLGVALGRMRAKTEALAAQVPSLERQILDVSLRFTAYLTGCLLMSVAFVLLAHRLVATWTGTRQEDLLLDVAERVEALEKRVQPEGSTTDEL